MIRHAIEAVVDGGDLSMDQAAAAMDEIMSGEATTAQFGALVTAPFASRARPPRRSPVWPASCGRSRCTWT